MESALERCRSAYRGALDCGRESLEESLTLWKTCKELCWTTFATCNLGQDAYEEASRECIELVVLSTASQGLVLANLDRHVEALELYEWVIRCIYSHTYSNWFLPGRGVISYRKTILSWFIQSLTACKATHTAQMLELKVAEIDREQIEYATSVHCEALDSEPGQWPVPKPMLDPSGIALHNMLIPSYSQAYYVTPRYLTILSDGEPYRSTWDEPSTSPFEQFERMPLNEVAADGMEEVSTVSKCVQVDEDDVQQSTSDTCDIQVDKNDAQQSTSDTCDIQVDKNDAQQSTSDTCDIQVDKNDAQQSTSDTCDIQVDKNDVQQSTSGTCDIQVDKNDAQQSTSDTCDIQVDKNDAQQSTSDTCDIQVDKNDAQQSTSGTCDIQVDKNDVQQSTSGTCDIQVDKNDVQQSTSDTCDIQVDKNDAQQSTSGTCDIQVDKNDVQQSTSDTCDIQVDKNDAQQSTSGTCDIQVDKNDVQQSTSDTCDIQVDKNDAQQSTSDTCDIQVDKNDAQQSTSDTCDIQVDKKNEIPNGTSGDTCNSLIQLKRIADEETSDLPSRLNESDIQPCETEQDPSPGDSASDTASKEMEQQHQTSVVISSSKGSELDTVTVALPVKPERTNSTKIVYTEAQLRALEPIAMKGIVVKLEQIFVTKLSKERTRRKNKTKKRNGNQNNNKVAEVIRQGDRKDLKKIVAHANSVLEQEIDFNNERDQTFKDLSTQLKTELDHTNQTGSEQLSFKLKRLELVADNLSGSLHLEFNRDAISRVIHAGKVGCHWGVVYGTRQKNGSLKLAEPIFAPKQLFPEAIYDELPPEFFDWVRTRDNVRNIVATILVTEGSYIALPYTIRHNPAGDIDSTRVELDKQFADLLLSLTNEGNELVHCVIDSRNTNQLQKVYETGSMNAKDLIDAGTLSVFATHTSKWSTAYVV